MQIVRRVVTTVLAVALSVVAGGAEVSAGSSSDHSGTYGRHYLADGQEYPGVLCRYDADSDFHAVRVDPPFVYAADRTGGVDSQKVGWAFRVQKAESTDGPWTNIYTSTPQLATATDARSATFSRMSHRFAADQVPTSLIYRVRVLFTWYTGGTVTGRAFHTVEWYHGGAINPAFGPHGYCPGFQF